MLVCGMSHTFFKMKAENYDMTLLDLSQIYDYYYSLKFTNILIKLD